MGEALIFLCETATSNADGSVLTYGECLLGPIRVGAAVARVVHDVDSDDRVSLTVTAVRAPGQEPAPCALRATVGPASALRPRSGPGRGSVSG